MGIKVVYEDKDLIAVNKESGVSVQDSASNQLSLQEEIQEYIKEKDNKPGNVFLGIIHRLDTNVEGIIVFAKNSKSASRLSEQIRDKTFKKSYVLVTDKAIQAEKGTMTDHIEKDEVNLKAVVTKDEPNAKLEYKLISKRGNLNLYKVNLHTGKFHQIRAQFATRGAPLLGDLKYGSKVKLDRKIALFANQIEFTHPREKTEMVFSETPETSVYPWNAFITELKSL